MRAAEPGADDTIRIPPEQRRKRAKWPFAVVAGACVVVAASAAFWLVRPHSTMPPPFPTAQVSASSTRGFQIQVATETEIGRHVPTSLTVFRLADNPRILVLDFASLHEQGKMFNRVAAFVEKAGLPHDRVLTDSELDAAILARGDTVETFYFGHDYAASALARFFERADSQRIELDPQEEKLRALLREEGWFAPNVAAGLISLPTIGSDPRITASARTTILRHELSHGEFFSNPAYAEYVHNFWMQQLTEAERAGVRAFLGREEYDVSNEELMCNEMQAYLMFTRDPVFFSPAKAGLTLARLAELRTRFLADMPAGWLHNVLASDRGAASQP
jgi:hypothetical protein